MNRHVFVLFSVLVALNVFCTLSGGSSIAPWNSVTHDASNAFSVDIPLEGSARVDFSVTAGSSYEWTWFVNGDAFKDSEGKSSQVSYVFDEYGHYDVTAVGTKEDETVGASWNVTVWLVIGEENDVRELEGLEDYSLRISQRPERIVSMAPSCTEILFAVGAGDQVVGVTEYCDYPPEMVERRNRGEIAVIGGYSTPSFEKIVALEPDLVVGAYGNPDDVLYWLVDESAHPGITYPVYAQNPKDIEEILTHVEVIGALTGCEETSASRVEALRARLEAVESETESLTEAEKPRVYYTLGEFFTAGGGTFITEVIELAGGRNVAASTSGYFVINLEELIDKNPQVIICDQGMGTMSLAYEEIMSDQRLQVVEAVKHDWVYVIDGDIMDRPGPRVVEAVERVHEDYRAFFNATSPPPGPTAEPGVGGGSSAKGTPEPRTTPMSAASLETRATRTVPLLPAGEEVTMLFANMDISLLTLKAESNVNDVVIVVERIEKPIDLPEPPDIPYAYLSITGDCEEAPHLAGKVEFKVAKSWLADNHIDGAAVTLSRYQENEGWIALPTAKVSEDNATVYFEAETLAFSVFVITGVETVAETPAPAPIVASAAIPVTTPTPTPVAAATPAPASELPGFRAVFTVAGLLAGAYLLSLRMKKRA